MKEAVRNAKKQQNKKQQKSREKQRSCLRKRTKQHGRSNSFVESVDKSLGEIVLPKGFWPE